MCGISGVVRLDKEELDTKAFYTALSLMRHRGPDDEGTVFISTDTGRFEERGGPDTPSELHLFSLFIPTTFGANLGLGNRRACLFLNSFAWLPVPLALPWPWRVMCPVRGKHCLESTINPSHLKKGI
jgi:hypothetical protein